MLSTRGTTAILLVSIACSAPAQNSADTTGMLRSTVGDLLDAAQDSEPDNTQRTDLTDHASKDVREAPGIVFVLTKAEIRASGAMILQDALMLVPGMTLGRDVDDVVGLGIRGNWAEEGKCLVMLNGIPLNETSFGTAGLALQLPLENVERIEVMNGPGSAMYGGYAALGVVNVITTDASVDEGLKVTGSSAFSNGTTSRSRAGVYGSHRVSERAEMSYGVFLTNDVLSTSQEELADGSTLNYADSTRSELVNGYIELKRRHLRGQFNVADRSFDVADRSFSVRMRDVSLRLSNIYPIGRKGTLSASLGRNWQLPWNYYNDTTFHTIALNTANQRTSGSVVWHRSIGKIASLTCGTEGWFDQYRLNNPVPGEVFNMVPSDRANMWDAAGYVELAMRMKWLNIIAGARAEHQDLTGNYFAPRLAFTRRMGRFHGKLLLAKAFKVPTMENIEAGPSDGSIIGERVATEELELGYGPNDNVQLSVNAFNVTLKDPIVYVYDMELLDNYVNRHEASTQGLELAFRANGERSGLFVALSTYRANAPSSALPEIGLPDDLSEYQGMPRHKAVLVAHTELFQRFQPELGCTWSSEAHAYQFTDAEQTELGLVTYDASLLINAGLGITLPHLEGLTARLGCNNVLDQDRYILSPYNNGSTSLPGRGREWVFTLQYAMPL